MTNPPRRKGTAAETAVVKYLRGHGHPYAERRALSGGKDKGDVGGIPGLVFEVKDCQKTELAQWVDEANLEADNVGGITHGLVVHKRRGKGNAGDWFVTMDLRTFCEWDAM